MSQIIDLDLTGYKDRFGAYLAPGRYHVIVEDLEVVSSKKEKEAAAAERRPARLNMINLWFRVADRGEFEGLVQTDRLMLEGGALFRTVGFLQALGMPTKRGKMRIDGQRWLGKHLLIDTRDGDPYNGQVRSEIAGYARLPKGEQADEPEYSGDGDLPEPEETVPAQATVQEPPFEPDATPAEPETPATASPARAATPDPETVSLDDIDLG